MQKDLGKRVFIIVVICVLVVVAAFLVPKINAPKKVAYSEFINRLEAGTVESVTLEGDELTYSIFGDKTKYITQYTANIDLAKEISQNGAILDVKADSTAPDWSMVVYIMSGLLMTAIIVVAVTSSGGSMKNDRGETAKKSKKRKIIVDKSSGVSFSDVGGNDEAKASLKEIIDFLENPKEYEQMGAQLPKGTLLVGPPGTGKTLLAKAVAGEAKVPFIYMAGSDFVEMYVGLGAAKVRRMFEIAQKNAPCIIFIDEIDAIGKKRDPLMGGSGSDERDQTLNQLLSEMDGFNSSKGIVVLAATNRPDILDEAITRPGRFDRRIIVDKPDYDGRKKILGTYIKKISTSGRIDIDQIAYATAGCTGADLANIINEAAIRAVRSKKKSVDSTDIQDAMDDILSGGCNHSVVLSEIEKCIIATHEASHALACIALDAESAVNKVSIIPRSTDELGYTLNYKGNERHVAFKDEMLLQIRILIAGYCGEFVLLDNISSAAAADLREATEVARDMVATYGMSTEFGPVTLNRTCFPSDEMKFCVEKKIIEVIKHCYLETIDFIQDNSDILQDIARELVQKETLDSVQIRKIIGDRIVKVPQFKDFKEAPTLTDTKAPSGTASAAKKTTETAPKPAADKKLDDAKKSEPAASTSKSVSGSDSKKTEQKKTTHAKSTAKDKKKEEEVIEIDDKDFEEAMKIEMEIPDIEEPKIEMEIPEINNDFGKSDDNDKDDMLPEIPKKKATNNKRKTSKTAISESDAKNKKAIEDILNISTKGSQNKAQSVVKKPVETVSKSSNDDDELTEDDY